MYFVYLRDPVEPYMPLRGKVRAVVVKKKPVKTLQRFTHRGAALYTPTLFQERIVDSSTRLTSARLDLSVCRVKVPAGVTPAS